jgi:hypothetical protein
VSSIGGDAVVPDLVHRRVAKWLVDLSWIQPALVEWGAQRLLIGAARLGSRNATDALWRLMELTDSPAVWRALLRRGRPARADFYNHQVSLVALGAGTAEPDAVAEQAMRFDHPIGDIARARITDARDPAEIDALCKLIIVRCLDRYHDRRDSDLVRAVAFGVEAGLVPSDDATHACWLLVTAQAERRAAVDPSGTLLATHYRSADVHARREMRAVLAEAADLPTLMRVMADDEDDGGDRDPLTAADVVHLADANQRSGTPEGLWAMAKQLTVVDLRACVSTLDVKEWCPHGDADRVLFERLRLAPKDTGYHSWGETAGDPRLATLQRDARRRISGVSFAPDGLALAVTSQDEETGRQHLQVWSLSGGVVVEEYDWAGDLRLPIRAFHLGDALVVASARSACGSVPLTRLDRCDRGRFTHLDSFEGAVTHLAGHGDGHAALLPHHLRLGRRGVPGSRVVALAGAAHGMVSGPDGAWLALGGDGVVLLDGRDGTVRDRDDDVRLGAHHGLCAIGPDRLAGFDTRTSRLVTWDVTADRLVRAEVSPPIEPVDDPGPASGQVIFIPALGAVAVTVERSWRTVALRYLDLEGFEAAHPDLDLAPDARLYGSPGNESFAVTGGRTMRILHTPPRGVAALTRRPIGRLTPADRETVATALARPDPAGAWRSTLIALEACLDHRFGTGADD